MRDVQGEFPDGAQQSGGETGGVFALLSFSLRLAHCPGRYGENGDGRGLYRCARGIYQAILMDVQMPVMHDHVSKPMDLPTLFEMLHRLLERKN